MINKIYQNLCSTRSDINEHLPLLKRYAEGNRVIEMGVRNGISTAAFLAGNPIRLTSYDIVTKRFNLELLEAAAKANINFQLIQANVLEIEIEETDVLFIDTLHTYSQLKKELALHAEKVKKYIILHDTVSFRHVGEKLKGQLTWEQGLYPAIQEALQWKIKEEYFNNNGLIVLERA